MAWLRFPLIIGVVLNYCNIYAIWEYMLGYSPDIPLWLIFILNDLYTIVLPSMVSTLFIISGTFVLYNILVKFTPKIAKIITGNRG